MFAEIYRYEFLPSEQNKKNLCSTVGLALNQLRLQEKKLVVKAYKK